MISSWLSILALDQLGESDCEDIGDGFLAQPVNALSSLTYTLLGVWLVVRALRRRTHETAVELIFAAALASVGIGSVAFHGPVPPGARLLHDLTIASVFAVMAARNLGAIRAWNQRTVIATFAVTTALVGIVMAAAPDAGNMLTGVVAVTAVGLEIYLYRSGANRLSRRVARLLGTIVVLLVGAAVINLLGRTGGPLCSPDSIFQGHALWHALTAVAFALYGYSAFPASAQDPEVAVDA